MKSWFLEEKKLHLAFEVSLVLKGVFAAAETIAGKAEALIEGARLFAHSADGLMPWRGRPAALKRGLVARTPPFEFHGEPE